MLRRTDTGASIDIDAARARLRETSYQRANRQAEAIKAARNASCTKWWKADGMHEVWLHLVQLSFHESVEMPTERTVFLLLEAQTRDKAKDVRQTALRLWKVRKRGPWESLRDLHARLGLTLEWFNGEAVLLDKDEAA